MVMKHWNHTIFEMLVAIGPRVHFKELFFNLELENSTMQFVYQSTTSW